MALPLHIPIMHSLRNLVCRMTRRASHCGQACCVPSRLDVVLRDCAAVLARWVGGLKANVVGLDVGRAGALVLACDCRFDFISNLA